MPILNVKVSAHRAPGLSERITETLLELTSRVLGKRRDSTQIYYRLQSERVATLCRAVCTQVAIEMDPAAAIDPSERLRPGPAR